MRNEKEEMRKEKGERRSEKGMPHLVTSDFFQKNGK